VQLLGGLDFQACSFGARAACGRQKMLAEMLGLDAGRGPSFKRTVTTRLPPDRPAISSIRASRPRSSDISCMRITFLSYLNGMNSVFAAQDGLANPSYGVVNSA
jgi:hypothetical protein